MIDTDFQKFGLIGICGAGSMGAGIAQVAAQAGHDVIVLDQNTDAVTRGRASVEKSVAALIERGKIDGTEAADIEARIRWTVDAGDLANADLVIEAIIENVDAKSALFARLEAVLSPRAVIATNTSSLSVTGLASGLRKPGRFVGLHFFNPAPVMKLVEVVRGLETHDPVAQSVFGLMEDWGKKAVMARDVPGFIVNRVARPFYGEGWRAFEEGAADAATIDFVYRDLAGFRMGPLELGDLIGHDINSAAAQSVYDAYFGKVRFVPSLQQAQMVAAGRLGRKSGRGIYDYGAEVPVPQPQFSEPGSGVLDAICVSAQASKIRTMFDVVGTGYTIRENSHTEDDWVDVGGALVAFTDGRTAGQRASLSQQSFVVLDWMRGVAEPESLVYATSDANARDVAGRLAALLGKKAIEISDRPGLIVFRTLAQLANCAADAVRDRVGDSDSIELAMRFGVNYPFGPLDWAREHGLGRVVAALDRIASTTGDPMYRPNEILRAMAEARP